ncbi:MAG: YncE family protein [Oscillochloridaceae bacterium umkhey_bin13]
MSFDPFASLDVWTEAQHLQWRAIRRQGRWAFFRYSMIRWLATPLAWAMAAIAVLIVILNRSTAFAPDDPLPWTQYFWVVGLLLFFGMLLLMGVEGVSRWSKFEQIYAQYEAPRPILDFVVGSSPDHLFAWMSADDFGGTRHVLLAELRHGTWAPLYTKRGMPTHAQGERPWVSPALNQPSDRPFVPDEVGMVLMPNGTLIITRRDATILVFDQPEPRIIATPGIVGYPASLADGRLFVAGVKGWSKHSARINLATGALEPIDVLTDNDGVAIHNGHAYVFDYGRAQIAIIGADSLAYVAHPPTWRPWWLAVAPDGTLWSYVSSRSGASSALWVYRDTWQPGPELDEAYFPQAMTHDGPSTLVACKQAGLRLANDGTQWITEQTFDPDQDFALVMMQTLTQGTAVFPRFAYVAHSAIMVRRNGTWQACPSLDPMIASLHASRAHTQSTHHQA